MEEGEQLPIEPLNNPAEARYYLLVHEQTYLFYTEILQQIKFELKKGFYLNN